MPSGQTGRKTTTTTRRRGTAGQTIPPGVLEAQRRAAEEAIERNAIREPTLKQRLVAIGHGARFETELGGHTNMVQAKTAVGYGDADSPMSRGGRSFEGLRLEDISAIVLARTQEAHAIGRAIGADETRETWRKIMARDRLETTAALLGRLGDELAPILKGLGAPKGAGDAKRREALTALVGLCGELAAAGRAVQEELER